jgi:hypothetical protein
LTFNIVGDDPKLSSIIESSDFDYAIKDQIKVVYHIELTIKENVDNAAKPTRPRSCTFQFQYYRTNYDMLRKAIGELCRYVATKGASLEAAMPTEPAEPETKPFDQEKSNSYGQNSVTQPYHSPAQIAAAAQGNLLPSYHLGNQHNMNYHQGSSNGMYHQNHNQHSHQNGFHGHGHNQPHYGRGFQPMQSGNFGPNRGAMNGNRHGHNTHHAPVYQGYSSFQSHPANRGNGGNHANPLPHYNNQYAPPGGMSVPLNGSNGYPRRFVHNPSTPTGDSLQSPGSGPTGYQIPRTGPMATHSPLDNLSSLELPEISAPPTGSNGGYRTHQETHTPVGNGGPFNPPVQSYFPPQPNHVHNGFAPGQGYNGGPPQSRYQN